MANDNIRVNKITNIFLLIIVANIEDIAMNKNKYNVILLFVIGSHKGLKKFFINYLLFYSDD